MAQRSRVITMSPLILNQEDEIELDLDLWEVVNPSDGEFSDDSFSVDSLPDDDVISLDDASFVSPTVISPPPEIIPVADGGDLAVDLDGDGVGDDVVRDEVDENDLGWAQRQMMFLDGGYGYSVGITYGDYVNDDGEEDRGGEDGEYDDSYDLDEELVPRSVSKKVGRQRMRKLGKRAIAKVYASKKMSPFSHLTPGIVRGKHGLSMKIKC
ncbi:hypothetical protein ISN45_Aa07g005820 [Arabidopsis thaliana x Arabidopsis arenosa]|uniref:Uncharacterized protein n=1 Tax=Arabidopsis thaliana x Arabidopsis arenosa TaxID=1240361 RepID=A0A8T1Y040_9BRAS|nr:hypothetical protein ISN45_Aa07g005820 [Arabidopsis thaliana x Arabidopsis arenosa]